MIPFFRKIRKKMADDNKPLKYMRYAIGNYSKIWPGNYLPNNINEKQDSLRATFINDVEFYNLIRNTINKTYIQLMNAKLLDNDYKKISKLIEQELEGRNFKMD